MPAQAELGRIGWLAASLGTQRQRVMNLLGRIADLGQARFEKPALFQKFVNLIDQVAVAKDEETALMSEIDAIENLHRFNRSHGMLKHPKRKHRAYINDNIANPDCEDEADDQDAKRFLECDEYDEEYEEYCEKFGLHTDQDQSGPPAYLKSVIGPPADWSANYTQQQTMNSSAASTYATSASMSAPNRRPNRTAFWLFAAWLLLCTSSNNKNQSLNAD